MFDRCPQPQNQCSFFLFIHPLQNSFPKSCQIMPTLSTTTQIFAVATLDTEGTAGGFGERISHQRSRHLETSWTWYIPSNSSCTI